MTARRRITVRLPLGDANGIGPEIALKAALDDRVRRAARVILTGDPAVLAFYHQRLGLAGRLEALEIDPVEALMGDPAPGLVSAEAGRATVAYADHAIRQAMADGSLVVAAPHNETAVARAGIAFSGYPGLLAAATGCDPETVFLMLVSRRFRIVHVTLHLPLRAALEAITGRRVIDAGLAGHAMLQRCGFDKPRIAVCGINPHAGEGGLMGDEDRRLLEPAVEALRDQGVRADGPAGADLLLAENRHDGYLAMYHDQGHIPVKLEGRGNSFGLSIGTPVPFATVAHGSAHDRAGLGTADAAPLCQTILQAARLFAPAPV